MNAPSETGAGAGLKGLDIKSRQMILDTVSQIRKRLLPKEKVLEFDKNEIFPEETIRRMLDPDIGLQLLFIPEAYDGIGGGARDCVAVTREMSKICLGVATAFFAIQLGADPLLVGGTEAQKAKWLGAIAEGKSLVAYAATEPEAGSNLAALQTTADPVTDEEGKIIGYTINGAKQFISTGGYADFITLLAKAPEGPTFFVVEKGAKGFIQEKGEEKHGIRASNTSPLSFNNTFVPVENLIGGKPGLGLKQANQVFGYTRVMVGAMALGAGEAALDIAVDYAKQRIQFGSPLSEKQGYTHKLIVPNAVRLEAAAAYLDEIALRLDSGDENLQVEGSIGKYFATEAGNKAAEDAIQALGGYGYIAEFEVEKIKRDVRITTIYEGASEIQQNIISTMRWKTTRKTKGEHYLSISRGMKALEAGAGNAGCLYYGLAAEALNHLIDLAHENRLTRQQFIMFALADLITHVEVGASLARKALTLPDTADREAEKLQAMSRIFACDVAQLTVQTAARILLGSGLFDKDAVDSFFKTLSSDKLLDGYRNTIPDMDLVADILFKRC